MKITRRKFLFGGAVAAVAAPFLAALPSPGGALLLDPDVKVTPGFHSYRVSSMDMVHAVPLFEANPGFEVVDTWVHRQARYPGADFNSSCLFDLEGVAVAVRTKVENSPP